MRCYNVAPDGKYRRYLEEQKAARERMKAAGFRVTYFPMENKLAIFKIGEYPPFGDEMFDNSVAAEAWLKSQGFMK